MIRITGKRRAWMLIAAAITIAALRRSYELIKLIFANKGNPPDTTGELFSFLTSICMAIGVAYIAPLFLSIKDSEESLRKSEEALLEQQNFTSSLIQSSCSATFVLDKTHRIMIWNKACEELTGCRQSDMIGTNNQWKPFYSDKKPTVADLILDGAPGHSPLPGKSYSSSSLNPQGIRSECWYENPGGKNRYIVFEASPVHNINGELIAAIETLQDITESKKLEEQLRQSQKMETIGLFAGGVAHDFNNILTAIIGFGTTAKKRLKEDNKTKTFIEEMIAGAKRAAELTRGLLAFSRKQVICPKPRNLNEIVSNMEKMLKRIMREDIEFRTILSDRDIIVMVDPVQMDQVLLNLATNARDAMPDGGHFIIETGVVNIDDCYAESYLFEKTGKYAVLTVSDTGIGMDLKTRENIFEPFFTTKKVGKGTGLGLAIVYGIVKQHGGNINVYSEPGKGTTFKIYLPMLQAENEEGEEHAPSAPQGKGETILIAEDDDDVRRILRITLEEYGYEVVEAVNGEEAVRNFEGNMDKVFLIILDVIMPIKNGRGAYEKIKKLNPDIKTIFMSGYTDDIIAKNGMLEEGFDFISKPINPETLMIKIREVLNR